MKKLLTVVFAMLLTGGLAFAQATSGSTGSKSPVTTSKKAHKAGKKAHKGGKKGKKGSSTTPASQPAK